MRILTALTYYRPHYSGLTIYAERLARALARRGHQITVLTSQYDSKLSLKEVHDGVCVERLPVWLRISKGVIMPRMLLTAWQRTPEVDVLHLHVPQLDAAPLALIGRLRKKPVVLTYHCDLKLPKGFIHRIANLISDLANHIAARAADVIVTNTRDYAENSNFLRRYLSKILVIPPPIELPPVNGTEVSAFRERHELHDGMQVIGMAARLATEKGVEHLVKAMPQILAMYPKARVLFVGQYQNVLGEEAYAASLAPLIQSLGEHWQFLGTLSPGEFAAFFHAIDVLIFPSTNSTDSYGMVQAEAMICGTPVVASDLPGVRQPVKMTGMGQVVPVANSEAIANAVISILDTPAKYSGDSLVVSELNAPQKIAGDYERIFETLIREKELPS